MAMVRTDGLGMYAKPLRFGTPGGAVRLTLAPVTLKPAKLLSPGMVLAGVNSFISVKRTCVGDGRVVVDIDRRQMSFM